MINMYSTTIRGVLKYAILVLVIAFVLGPWIGHMSEAAYDTETANGINNAELISAFWYRKTLLTPPMTLPTVVEQPTLENDGAGLLIENETGLRLPYHIHTKRSTEPVPYTVSEIGGVSLPALTDGLFEKGIDFALGEERGSVVQLVIQSEKPITASEMKLTLDSFVSLPRTIDISAIVNGSSVRVLATAIMSAEQIYFPETTSDTWTVILMYDQPLRINEIELVDRATPSSLYTAIRFLAQPGKTYTWYHGFDRYVQFDTIVGGDYTDDRGVVLLKNVMSQPNPDFVPLDTDGDTIPDKVDNCLMHANSDQHDTNQNSVGDVCEDHDKDGVMDQYDNCQTLPNSGQQDTDIDGLGDVCDGEESRFTEKYGWVPWLGIVIAGVVICILFLIVQTGTRKEPDVVHTDS